MEHASEKARENATSNSQNREPSSSGASRGASAVDGVSGADCGGNSGRGRGSIPASGGGGGEAMDSDVPRYVSGPNPTNQNQQSQRAPKPTSFEVKRPSFSAYMHTYRADHL